MRKFLTSWLAATLLVALAALPAAAKGPKCADIQSTNADGTQTSRAAYDGLEDTVNGQFFLAAKSCKNVVYTLVILDDEGDANPVASGFVMGDGETDSVIISLTGVTTADNDACAYVTTSRSNGNELDRAPADGCVTLLDDGTTPAGGKGF